MPAKRKSRTNRKQSQKKKRTSSPQKGTNGLKSCASYPTKDCAFPNIAQCMVNVQMGRSDLQNLRKASHYSIIKEISNIHFCNVVSPFDRRVTFLKWHPKNSKLLFVGSKCGGICLWNSEQTYIDHKNIIIGKGAGDSILNIICNPDKQEEIYTSSLEGTVGIWNFKFKDYVMLIDLERRFSQPRPAGSQMNTSTWCTGLDVDFSGGSIAVGDNAGFLSLLSIDGNLQWRARVHKAKIRHVEYFKRDTRFLVTASVDHTVKIWDTRFISDAKPEENELAMLNHKNAVNSAYFSASGSGRLLTTDQHSELRVYRAPLWNLERTIPHPHRQFQHLTPIKATWHPLEDIVVVGRYPDPHFPGYKVGESRSVDFFHVETGTCVYRMTDPRIKGIMSLNSFNNNGEILASGMGYNALLWRINWEQKA